MKALQSTADEAIKNAGKDAAKVKAAGSFKKELDVIIAKVKQFETA
jgi:hypothetical protein